MKIYTDLHIYGIRPYVPATLKYDDDCYYIGDNVDLSNCPKKLIPQAEALDKEMRERSPGRYVSGNHERDTKGPFHIVVNNDVLLTHGDIPLWGLEKAMEYRSKKKGKSKWKRFLKNLIWKKAKPNGKPTKLSKKQIERCVALANDFKCKTIIMGHRHPGVTYDKVHEGIRVIVLTRGYNELEL